MRFLFAREERLTNLNEAAAIEALQERRLQRQASPAEACRQAPLLRHQFRKQRYIFRLEFRAELRCFRSEQLTARFRDYDLLLLDVSSVMGGNMARNTSPMGAR